MAHATNYANVINFGDLSPNQSLGLFARLSQALADYRAYRAVFEELASLTDRELADLGISRLALRDIARDAAIGR